MKRIKMVLYGEPGTGKSVFASKAPKPFFICTDGNYEWLEDFGADPNAHATVTSWSEIKSMIEKPDIFDDYETIVLDLTEDAFKWCEQEYCVRNKIEHLSDLGYGKGYDATRNEFFICMSKLIALDKNIIFIMHGLSYVVKDRRGVEHTKYGPSSRIPDKVLDMIEGRVRYFLRCYLKDEELEDGTLIKRRYLSLVPKPNEFGIIRGVNENSIPHDIPLDFGEFASVIGFEHYEKPSDSDKKHEIRRRKRSSNEVGEPEKLVQTEEKTEVKVEEPEQIHLDIHEKKTETTEEKANNDVHETKAEESKPETANVVQPAEKAEQKSETISNIDKLAAIKAKLAALNKK